MPQKYKKERTLTKKTTDDLFLVILLSLKSFQLASCLGVYHKTDRYETPSFARLLFV